ncbi:MAG: hypothetical protein KJN97_02070, partial [Deltaproteobacteria bacterium]|nr:hypothetical protein [Deltaproteobacteria bacterium]
PGKAGRGRAFRVEVVRTGYRFHDVWLPPALASSRCQALALADALRQGEIGADFEAGEIPEFQVSDEQLTAWHCRLPEPDGSPSPGAEAGVVSTLPRHG